MGFIIIDPNTKQPMGASRALALLEDTNALERLRASGYNAEEFRAAVPPPEVQGGSCLSRSPSVLTAAIFNPLIGSMVGGIVGGVIGITAVVLLLLFVLVGVVLLYKRR